MPLSTRDLIYLGAATQAAEGLGCKLVEFNLDGLVLRIHMTPRWYPYQTELKFYSQRELDMAKAVARAEGRAEMEAEMLERITTATAEALAEGERRAMERMQPVFAAVDFLREEAMIAQAPDDGTGDPVGTVYLEAEGNGDGDGPQDGGFEGETQQAQGTFHDNDGQQEGGSANLNGGDVDGNSDQPGPDSNDNDAGPDESDVLTLEANLFGIKVSARAVFSDDAVTVSASIGGMVLIDLTIRDATNREPSPDGAQPDPDGTTDA